jgi:thioredoxin 1
VTVAERSVNRFTLTANGDAMGFNAVFAETEPTRAAVDALPDALVIEFGTPWCGHCQAAQALLAQAFAAHRAVRHLKIEDGPGRPLGRSFRVKLWPTLVFMRQGREIERLVRPSDVATIAGALDRLEAAADA